MYINIISIMNSYLNSFIINMTAEKRKRNIPKSAESGFGGLGVACWPLVHKFAGSNPAEAVGFPSEAK
jgi:hypothetical protein